MKKLNKTWNTARSVTRYTVYVAACHTTASNTIWRDATKAASNVVRGTPWGTPLGATRYAACDAAWYAAWGATRSTTRQSHRGEITKKGKLINEGTFK